MDLNSVLIEGTVARAPKETRPNGTVFTFAIDCTRADSTARIECSMVRVLAEYVELHVGERVRVVGRLTGMDVHVEHVEKRGNPAGLPAWNGGKV